jgi:hypothetical protein
MVEKSCHQLATLFTLYAPLGDGYRALGNRSRGKYFKRQHQDFSKHRYQTPLEGQYSIFIHCGTEMPFSGGVYLIPVDNIA